MSQVPSTATSSTDFETIFRAALDVYKDQTKKDIVSHPLANQLRSCNSPSAILSVLRAQVQAFGQSHIGDEKWIRWLNPTVNVLYAFSAALGSGVGVIFPPANAIFIGIGVLLQTIKDVRARKDALLELFDRMESFFTRLEKYIDVRPSAAMKDIIVKIMAEVLSVLGIVTKEIRQGRTKKYLKKLIGRKDVENALQRLEKLTHEEARMAGAEGLSITRGIDDTVKVIDDKVDDVDKNIQDVGHTVKSVDYGVKLLDHRVKGVGHEVKGVSNRMKGFDHKVKGMDDKVGLVMKGVMDTGLTIQQMSYQVDDLNWNELRRDLRKWISPPDPSVNYNAATSAHHEGTAAWCTKGNTLGEWKTSGALLWIHGKPGSGKTVLSSVIIRDIKSMSGAAGSAFLAYFYFDFKDASKQDSRALLSSLLVQLSDQSDVVCNALFSLYSAHKRGSEQPPEGLLSRCLKDVLTMIEEPIFLIIDAVDECPNDLGIPSSREKVLELLKELVELGHPNLRLCITSRPEFDIRTMLEPLATQQLCHHGDSGQKRDIIDYVTFVVRSDKKMKYWRDDEKHMVIEKLTQKADGMFRWVFCQLEILRHSFPINLRRVLEELPKSLDETYKRILKEINNANRLHAYRLLQCLMVASRPLLVEELAEMLAFDLNVGGIPKFTADWRWEHQEEAVLSACSSLVSIIIQDGSRVVQFSHFSVKEFLTSDRLENCIEDVSRFYIPIEPSHALFAQACLGVLLNLDDRSNKDSAENIPLLRYAAEYWFQHAQVGDVEVVIKDTLDRFFDMDKPYFSAWVRIRDSELEDLLTAFMDEEPSAVPLSAGPSGLYFAAWRGFRHLVERLVIKNPQEVNQLGGICGTSLHASVLGGHIEVAQLLCAHGANIHSRSADNFTPLHIASQEGHLEIGKWLLSCDSDVNSRTKDGSTPLHFSAFNGHLEVCFMLLEYNAEVNARDDEGSTPLVDASENGHQDIVEFLLDHNADAHIHNNEGNTPLSLAARSGHHEIVQMLIVCNVEIDAQNIHGHTPLLLASGNGQRDVAEFLLDHDADANVLDNDGYTPLSWAADGGYLEVALILLKHNAEINCQTVDGDTPLLLASGSGHQDVVQLLLDHNADASAVDINAYTPLSLAAVSGYLEVVQILLMHNVEINCRTVDGDTPLILASWKGHQDVVQLLLDHNADANIVDNNGLTPLSWAAYSGYPEVAQILIKHGVEINCQTVDGDTPLLLASGNGHQDVVQLLLDNNADVHVRDNKGNTPLFLGASYGHLEISRLLLERNMEVNSQNDYGSTPLLLASQGGPPDLVKFFLDHNADVHVRNCEGDTPLHYATLGGQLEVAQLLLESNVEVNSRNDHGSTPLLLASEFGTPDLVLLLLDHDADANARDNGGGTLLHRAVYGGQLDMARYLLELNMEANSRDDKGSTPLHLASEGEEGGNSDIVQLLLDHGADARSRNFSGQTASEVARGPKQQEIVQLLSKYAAV